MNKALLSLFAAIFLCGCKSTGMLLRYTYEPVFEQIPPCSRIVNINNEFVTYYLIEGEFGNTTNYYRAYYTVKGKIYKTEHVIK